MIDNVLSVFSAGYVAVMALALVVIFELKYRLELNVRQRHVVRVITLGIFGILSIYFHQNIAGDDVFIDMRGVGVALGTIFGGIAVGAITTFVEIVTRLVHSGGGSLAGTLGLILDYLLAVLALRFISGDSTQVRMKQLLLVGAAVGLGEAASLLLIQPFDVGSRLFHELGLSLAFTQLLGVFLFGWLLKMQDDRIRGRDHGRARIKNLNETMKAGVAALSTAMVHHDPSIAGHEQRVADLCVKVGQAIGMDETRLEGMQLAAMVHDVGQIRVPSEILSRPRRLSPEEFELVKLHVEAGYQILKDVPFPWPVADIIRQHHEHMDGSGYPNGLRGEQMLLEARILHVCDSIEAMTSHRPFRRAYSIERALEELLAHKTTRYDPQVVDIIVRLFRDEGYQFPDYKMGVTL